MKNKIHNSRQTYFYLILSLFGILVSAFVYLKVDSIITETKIEDQQKLLDQQNETLELSKNMTGFTKLEVAREIELVYENIPWSEHIPKLIEMLQDIKDIDGSDSETIVLSDFKISLDEVSLKGQVSKLRLLYYSNEERHFTALLDRFTELDFLDDIRIQHYLKQDDGYEFVLNAKVVNNDAK